MSRSLKKRTVYQCKAGEEGCSHGRERQEVGHQDLEPCVNDLA